MTKAKEQFLLNKGIRDWWLSVAKKEDFQVVLAHARAHLFEGGSLNPDSLAGANALAVALETIVDHEDEIPPLRGPSITHDLALKRKTLG